MRRRRKAKKDEAQSSLDAFTNIGADSETEMPTIVPSMPDLDALTRADEKARETIGDVETSASEPEGRQPLRTFNMPSMEQQPTVAIPEAEVIYHKLG
jgi:hypothetical protein